MKKWIVIGSLSVAIIVVAVILIINLLPKQKVVSTVAAAQSTTSKKSADVVQAPVTVPEQQTSVSSSPAVQPTQTAPETPVVDQYGFTVADWICINRLSVVFPGLFTDQEKERSYIYIGKVVNISKNTVCNFTDNLISVLPAGQTWPSNITPPPGWTFWGGSLPDRTDYNYYMTWSATH